MSIGPYLPATMSLLGGAVVECISTIYSPIQTGLGWGLVGALLLYPSIEYPISTHCTVCKKEDKKVEDKKVKDKS